jgi:hypothetical protein
MELFEAARDDKPDVIESLLASGVNVNTKVYFSFISFPHCLFRPPF